MRTELQKLKDNLNIVKHGIRWAKYALDSPKEYVSEELQAFRYKTLISLLQQQAELEVKIMRAETIETLHLMAMAGVRFTTSNGNIYILP